MTDNVTAVPVASAERLRDLALRHGWSAYITTAEGPRLSSPDRTVVSTAVRMVRPDNERLVGLWEDGRFRSGVDLRRMAVLSMKQLKAHIEAAT